jgi:hypothetical protein
MPSMPVKLSRPSSQASATSQVTLPAESSWLMPSSIRPRSSKGILSAIYQVRRQPLRQVTDIRLRSASRQHQQNKCTKARAAFIRTKRSPTTHTERGKPPAYAVRPPALDGAAAFAMVQMPPLSFQALRAPPCCYWPSATVACRHFSTSRAISSHRCPS